MSHKIALTMAVLLALTGTACATGPKAPLDLAPTNPSGMSQSTTNLAGIDHAGMDHEAHLKQMQADEQLEHQGAAAMGFDQQATSHHFLLSPQGGAIQVTVKDPADDGNRMSIRAHLKEIAGQFAAGDFEKPLMTHGEPPYGVEEMTQRREAIAYTFELLPDGGRVRISSVDTTAITAIHQFLRYQIREHKTGDPLTIRK